MKVRPVEAELFHADGRTGLRKLIVFFFLYFTNLPNNATFCSQSVYACLYCTYLRTNSDLSLYHIYLIDLCSRVVFTARYELDLYYSSY